MPHANIWIRKENEEAWESIQEKSEWLNDILSGLGSEAPKPKNFVSQAKVDKSTKTSLRDYGLCEHGAGPRLCLQKKCRNYQFK